ncbi:MAG: ABC transporter ATP-binding protein [Dissulfurimicrobium sp.]|uniref:ABC transporter ATP-binding protein n=1 Tax=Dissulfurimicrobium sp. TaxID=2022436 RepID=UPI003D0A054F
MLELERLTINTGMFSVKDVSLKIQPGSCNVLVGPTGCGKTTLLEAIIGIRRPDSGVIRLEGRRIDDLPIERRGIAYLPQDLALFPHLTVEGNIFYGLKHQKRLNERRRDFVLELAETLGITHLLKRMVDHLSGGERQRVALVRALATGSGYLLLDEPLSALHEAMKKDLWFLIADIKVRFGLAIVMVTHDMDEAFFMGDEIAVMIDGMIRQAGPRGEVYGHPIDIDVAGFFGIKNLFSAEVIRMRGKWAEVRCNELNTDLIVPAWRHSGTTSILQGLPFIIGIMPENVMLIRPDLNRRDNDNLLEGVVYEIFSRGRSNTLLFVPDGSDRVIEIDIPDYAMRKMDITKGVKAVVALRAEKIFTLTARAPHAAIPQPLPL